MKDHAVRRYVVSRLVGVVVALLAVGMLAAGCSGDSSGSGVATLGAHAGGAPTDSSSPSPTHDPVAYAACMRAHGLPDFPDPDSQGHIRLTPGSGMDPGDPTFDAAQKACGALMGSGPHAAGDDQDVQAAMLKYARCMRAHGISDFPDPTSQGLVLQSKPGSDLDPGNPTFKKAQAACQSLMPGGAQTHLSDGGDA